MLKLKQLFHKKVTFKRVGILLGAFCLTSNFALAGSWWRYTNNGWSKSNFSCTSGSRVAVLVHGLMQSHNTMTHLAKTLLNSQGSERSNHSVQQEDFVYDAVWCYEYGSLEKTVDVANSLYKDLIEPVNAVKELGFFVHSLGGLIVRHIHEPLDFPQEKCRTVFFGTPHAGISEQALLALARKAFGGGSFALNLASAAVPSISDLKEGSSFLQNLNTSASQNSKRAEQRGYYTIVGTSESGMWFNNKEVGSTMLAAYKSKDKRTCCDGFIDANSAEFAILAFASLPWRDNQDHHKLRVCLNHDELVMGKDALDAMKQCIVSWRSGDYVKERGLMLYRKRQNNNNMVEKENYIPGEEKEGVLLDCRWVLTSQSFKEGDYFFAAENEQGCKIVKTYIVSNGRFKLLELEHLLLGEKKALQLRANVTSQTCNQSVKYVLDGAGKLVDIERIKDRGLILDGTPVYILLNNQPKLVGLWSAQSDRINYLSLTDNLEITNTMIHSSVGK